MRLRGLPLAFLTIVLVSACVPWSPAQEGSPPAVSEGSAAAPPPVDRKQLQAAVRAAQQEEQDAGNAATLLQDASKYTNAIKNITIPAMRSTTPGVEDLQNLQAIVTAIQRAKLVAGLTRYKSLLEPKSGSDDEKRKTACGALPQDTSGQPKDVSDAVASCSKAESDGAARSAELDTALKDLTAALGMIPSFVKDQVNSLQEKIKSFSKLTSGTPDSQVILQVLPSGLPALRQVLESQAGYKSSWEGMKTALGSSSGTESTASLDASVKEADDAFNNLKTTTEGILPKLAGWFVAVRDGAQAAAKDLDGMISDVQSDPAKNSAKALSSVRENSEILGSVQSVVDGWSPLVGFLTDGEPQEFSLRTTKANFEELQKSANILRGSISRVHDALAGDAEQFETDQVSLYYFTDVNRLMYALNENVQTIGGVAEAQANAAAQRTALTQAELELADAQASVNRYQKQVLDLQEQQRQMQAKLKGLNSNLSKLGSRLNHAQADKANADVTYNGVQSQENHDPSKASALERAKAKQDAAEVKASRAQSDYDAAKTERDNAQKQMDESQNQSDSVPSKLAAAQQALSEAQTAVSRQRRNALMAAQAESDAFAFARDNTPYLYAPADASSRDPAKRVILYAFNDSKTIFMRGLPRDLDIVKGIISKFDQPAPQARLTLWTMELSADAEQKTNTQSADRLNQAMQIVDEELSNARAQVNTTLTLFRQLINDEVQKVEQAHATENPAWSTGTAAGPADASKWRRVHFYDQAVLDSLGVYLNQPTLKTMRTEVPDPSGTTTLGEALMVLNLAPPSTKKCIHDAFDSQIRSRLDAAPMIKSAQQNSESRQTSLGDAVDVSNPLFLTWQALGVAPDATRTPGVTIQNCNSQAPVGQDSLTASQLEITRALKTQLEAQRRNLDIEELGRRMVGLGPIFTKLSGLYKDQDRVQEELAIARQKQNQLTALGGPTLSRLSPRQRSQFQANAAEIVSLEVQLTNISNISVAPIRALSEYNIFPKGPGKQDHEAMLQEIRNVLQNTETEMAELRRAASLNLTTPRVAAADQMLKELMIAVEDDLDRLYVQPMLSRLRKRLVTQGNLRVGIVQRESLLATNRGLARVDPRASAQLAVGEEQDILTGVQQLAQLYATVQSGGALAAIGALQQQPREQQPEIYALTTGNRFQVTPVFDPSGQALRFKFDFVGSSKLQEPNGTTNPQFPRIERHTVNTEVQLSNLETREISRFESNAKLGLPTRYWGGFPIFKDIPYFRPWVPLLGWFVRKAGSNASAQQSVIFGQTTIYPTIKSMVDLLAESAGDTGGEQKNVEQKNKEKP